MYLHKREREPGQQCNARFNQVRCPACGEVVGLFYDEHLPGVIEDAPRGSMPRVFCSPECVEAVPCPFENFMSLKNLIPR